MTLGHPSNRFPLGKNSVGVILDHTEGDGGVFGSSSFILRVQKYNGGVGCFHLVLEIQIGSH